jgi:hypothetical protein
MRDFHVGPDDDRLSFLSMEDALEGDYGRLINRIRAGTLLSQNERNFIADYLLGKITRPEGASPKRSTDQRRFQIAWCVHYCEKVGGYPNESAVAVAMKTSPEAR